MPNDNSTQNNKQYQTPSKLFTTRQAAEYLGVHYETMRDYIASGKIEAINITDAVTPVGREYRITLDAINDFLTSRVVRRNK